MSRVIRCPSWGLVLGGGGGLWGEMAGLLAMVGEPWPGLIVAVNNAGIDYPGLIDHWATLHPEKLHVFMENDSTGDWLKIRKERGFPEGFETWSRRSPSLVDHVITPWGGGSSGFFALTVLHKLGCKRAVLCGVPMTESPHYHQDQGGKDWRHADLHWKSWVRHMHMIQGWVRSMSGRTAETLGVPNLNWLQEAGPDIGEGNE